MDLYFLFFFILSIFSIDCHSDLYTVVNQNDKHLSESPVYKYSEEANIKQYNKMDNFSLLNNNNLFVSILLINLIPILILFFIIPTTILRRQQFFLTIFLSFASGGLMADVFLRLVPHMNLSNQKSIDTQSQNDTQQHHRHLQENQKGLFILLGVFLSFLIEKFLRYLQNDPDNDNEQPTSNNILAYLFLLVDILHNYTTSLNFYSILSTKSSLSSTVLISRITYVILHIFYGYVILIHSGWSSAKAMRFQLLTGFVGTILCLIGIQYPSNILINFWSNEIFLPIITGIFVYISTVHIIPEVIENQFGMKGTFFKISACAISISIIYQLNEYE